MFAVDASYMYVAAYVAIEAFFLFADLCLSTSLCASSAFCYLSNQHTTNPVRSQVNLAKGLGTYRKGSGTNEDITKTKQTLRLQITCILKIVTCLPDPFLSACRALPSPNPECFDSMRALSSVQAHQTF